MSIGYTDLQHYSDIAAAIRSKNGSAATYTPAQMAAAILAIPTGATLDWGYISGITVKNPTASSSADLRGIDTSNFTTMKQMFNGCSNLSSLKVSGWDTSNVTDMNATFQACMNLTSLDLSGWDTASVTDMGAMFSMCRNLESVYMPDFDTTSVTTVSNMFSTCNNMQAIIWSQKSTVQHIPSPGSNSWIPSGATVYVPDALVSAYQSATNWSYYASQIDGISNLPSYYKTLYGIN